MNQPLTFIMNIDFGVKIQNTKIFYTFNINK
jgi:hypothetical protein